MKGFVFATVVALISCGTGYAQDRMPFMMGPTECAPLRTAGALLDLSREQQDQTRALTENYSKDLREEAIKARKALDEKYVAEVGEILTEEQKGKLEKLLVAEKAYQETLTKAEEAYRGKLLELFYAGEENENKLKGAERSLRYLPRQEKDLFQRYTMANDELRQKHTQIRTKYATITSKIHGEAGKVDWRDLKAAREWREKRDRVVKEADENFIKEALDLLNEDQAKVFAEAVEAQKKWKDTSDTAEKTYLETAKGVLGDDKVRVRQIQRHQKSIARKMRYY